MGHETIQPGTQISGFLRSGLLLFAAGVFLSTGTSCSSSSNPLNPTPEEIRALEAGQSITYTTSGVQVTATEDSFFPGESVAVGVVLDPAHLPANAYIPAAQAKVASVILSDAENSGAFIQDPLSVRIPIRDNEGVDNNSSLRLLMFDSLAGRWVNTSRMATIDDVTRTATFRATEFGTYGIFREIPFRVSIAPSRTTGKAPFSVSLRADIKGGTAPFNVIWYWGDDSDPDVGLAVSHIYADPFTYIATALVTDGAGKTATALVELRAH